MNPSHPLEQDDRALLQSMRGWMAGHLQERDQYRSLVGKLNSIDKALGKGSIAVQDIWKQKALGVALGDALCQELTYLQWVSVFEQENREIGLRWKHSEIVIFPLSEFSSRFEAAEPILGYDIFRSYVELFENYTHRNGEHGF